MHTGCLCTEKYCTNYIVIVTIVANYNYFHCDLFAVFKVEITDIKVSFLVNIGGKNSTGAVALIWTPPWSSLHCSGNAPKGVIPPVNHVLLQVTANF